MEVELVSLNLLLSGPSLGPSLFSATWPGSFFGSFPVCFFHSYVFSTTSPLCFFKKRVSCPTILMPNSIDGLFQRF